MEFNEISRWLDVKLDIYDKRPDSLKFKSWSKCQVKIEAIKCFPCFLRVNIESLPEDDTEEKSHLSVSINVPGVNTSLANSRIKQHSYGLFWTHNRRDSFIYFALDTELDLRRHMKWIKKSIKNLELYRQVFLEQRINSRYPLCRGISNKQDTKKELSAVKNALKALGPLPQVPSDANSSINWSRRVSRASDIYEEILDEYLPPTYVSRRLSRISMASGIYEEMKPCSSNIQSIVEELSESPPPVPPLPPHRKRINTYDNDPLATVGDIPRSSTYPETELAKKKKYKNVLTNILGTERSKRAESVSEKPTCTIEDIINDGDSQEDLQPIYANDVLKTNPSHTKAKKRNSFSSPDLSKINFLDTFDESKVADLLHLNISSDLDALIEDDFTCDIAAVHNQSSVSLDDSVLAPTTSTSRVHVLKPKSGSVESFNVSGLLPQNFNFSACNSSKINLVGSSGAVPPTQNLKRNKIIMEDDFTGYCIMAPIKSKNTETQDTATTATSSTTSSTTSGYSTGSYCSSSTSSSASSNCQAVEKTGNPDLVKKSLDIIEASYDELPAPIPVSDADLSNIYESMQNGSPLNCNGEILMNHENTPPLCKDFTGNLYENLLTIKAAQELEQPLPANVCTSTPTDSPAEEKQITSVSEDQENFYQTPRKSIISVDDKIPSYYPNSCDTVKMRRRSSSPNSKQNTPTTHKSMEKEKSNTTMGLKHLVNIKMKRERKENLFISSPQKIMEQRKKSSIITCPSTAYSKKSSKLPANAQKIADNVYAVNLPKNKSLQLNINNTKNYNKNNNNANKSPYTETNETAQLKENIHNELLQLALQNIDFKFDDTTTIGTASSSTVTTSLSLLNTSPPAQVESGTAKMDQAEIEYENCYQATKDATRLLHKYATLAPKQSMRITQQLQQHLQMNQSPTNKNLMTQSPKLYPVKSNELVATNAIALGSKKFASLPRFRKIDFSPLKLKINNVLQRNHTPDF